MTDAALNGSPVASTYPQRPGRPKAESAPDRPPSTYAGLDASRSRVRSALLEIAHPPRPKKGAGISGTLTGLLQKAPGMTLVLDTAQTWLRGHGATKRTIGLASQTALAPLVRSHPGAMIGAAAGVGAVLVLVKPWRFLLRPKVLLVAASLLGTQAIKGR